jgi:hypothetical protein
MAIPGLEPGHHDFQRRAEIETACGQAADRAAADQPLVNPLVSVGLERGSGPRLGLLETRSAARDRRVVPIGNRLRDRVLRIVTERGYHADSRAQPHGGPAGARVGRPVATGQARVLAGDDPDARLRALQRMVDDIPPLASRRLAAGHPHRPRGRAGRSTDPTRRAQAHEHGGEGACSSEDLRRASSVLFACDGGR